MVLQQRVWEPWEPWTISGTLSYQNWKHFSTTWYLRVESTLRNSNSPFLDLSLETSPLLLCFFLSLPSSIFHAGTADIICLGPSVVFLRVFFIAPLVSVIRRRRRRFVCASRCSCLCLSALLCEWAGRRFKKRKIMISSTVLGVVRAHLSVTSH